MEYQKINLLENTPNQPSKFRTKNWVEISDDLRGTHNLNSQIKFKTTMFKYQIKFKNTMFKYSLCDYSNAYILVKGIIKNTGAGAEYSAKQLDEINKGATFKYWAPYTDCISNINNTQVNNAKGLDVAMVILNLTNCSNNSLKTPGSLRQYRDEPSNNLVQFKSFESKILITGKLLLLAIQQMLK